MNGLLHDGIRYEFMLKDQHLLSAMVHRTCSAYSGDLLYVEVRTEDDGPILLIPWHSVLWVRGPTGDSIIDNRIDPPWTIDSGDLPKF